MILVRMCKISVWMRWRPVCRQDCCMWRFRRLHWWIWWRSSL